MASTPTRAAIEDRNAALGSWYREHRRDLPWRGSDDPYAILVSEVMLQQTQAGRVAERFPRFLARFPTVDALADAALAEVLDEWSGLGYNSRARRLRDAARYVVENGWPRTAAGLEQLPGVGPYTAAAVACFAFGEEVPAVDTNLRRVLSRWTGRALDGRRLWETARGHMGSPSDEWNQGVMDLGATVCTPRSPACERCPVTPWCAGPATYVPPPRQSPFAGSDRQVRGATLRALIGGGPLDTRELAARTGTTEERMAAILPGLVADGLVVREPGGFRTAD